MPKRGEDKMVFLFSLLTIDILLPLEEGCDNKHFLIVVECVIHVAGKFPIILAE
jgi:hypothetical protein